MAEVIGGEFKVSEFAGPAGLNCGKSFFSSGRSAFSAILDDLPYDRKKEVLIPDYLCSSITQVLMDKKIKPHLAMTGELSLTGQVLPIGGLREKTVAAKRNKIKTIIIPKANERDLEDIPAHVKQGIKFIPVSDVRQVLEIALGIKQD